MNYYPALLNIRDRPCLVVGGGDVGARKASGLVECGARVTVVSKEFLVPFVPEDQMSLKRRAYTRTDVDGKFLVFAATNHAGKNQEIAEDAKRAGALVCVADAPDQGNFIVPAVARQGDLICTVSTSGASPALSKKIRRELEQAYGPEYVQLLAIMKEIRQQMLNKGHDPDAHREIFINLVHSDLADMIAAGDVEAVNNTISQILGRKVSYLIQ